MRSRVGATSSRAPVSAILAGRPIYRKGTRLVVCAVCGWPLGSPERHGDVVMTNLLGEEASRWRDLAAEPRVHLHLYGKREARDGRKMGHVTALGPTIEAARDIARTAASCIRFGASA